MEYILVSNLALLKELGVVECFDTLLTPIIDFC